MAAVRPPFVGRRGELTRLQDLVGSAVAGNAAGVLLAGDAGVGKTSLLGELGRRASGAGMLVLTGRCVDLGAGGLPYLPFAEALSGLVRDGDANGDGPAAEAARVVREVAGTRPELNRLAGRASDLPADRAPGDSGLDRLALFESVTTVLARIAADVAPVLLVLEDLHWADSSTRDLVRFQLARLDRERLLVVASYRSDDLHRRHPLRPLLAELVRLPHVERIELSPFAGAELAEFLAAVNGAELPGDVVDEISRRSAGNAYFAEELVAAGPGQRLPAALADVLLDRLERLGPETQHVIRAAAVIGASRIDDRLLRAVAGGEALPPPALEDALREAVTHHVLEPEPGDRWTFRHALQQEAVYTDLLPAERVRLHAALARELAGTGEYEAEWARHALAAHDLPQALDASLAAAEAARRRLAPAEALAHYEQALQLLAAVGRQRPDDDGPDVVDLGIAAARVAGDAGQHERAIALAQAALAEAVAAGDPVRTAGVRSRLAIHLYSAEDKLEETREQARRAAAELGPSAERVWAWAIEARVDVSFGEPEAADRVIGPALTEARALGLHSTEADLLISLHSVDAQLGRPGDEEHLTAAREVAELAGDRSALLRVSYNVALNRWEDGDGAAALTAIAEAVAAADRAGLTSSLYATQCRWLHVTVLWMTGRPDEALAAVEAGRRQLPGPQVRAMEVAGLQVHVARDPAGALERAAALEVTDLPADYATRLALEGAALLLLGRPEETVHRIREALGVLEEDAPFLLAGLWMAVTGLEAAVELAAAARRRGDAEEAARHVAAGEEFAADGRARAVKGKPRRRSLGIEGRAWALRLEAEAARLTGDDPGPEPWRELVDAFGFARHEQAVMRRRLAERLLAAGDRDGAREQLAAALETAVRLGTAPLRQQVEDLARRGRLALGPAATGQPAGLTPRERDVMRLVAEGLTNRQIGERLFISEKTASVHISNVLAKLDVSGRAEAVAVATRRGLLD